MPGSADERHAVTGATATAGMVLGALGATLLLAAAAAATLAALPLRWRRHARQALLALLLPCACLAIWPGLLAVPLGAAPHRPAGLRPPLHLVLGALPLLLLPLASVLARLPPGQGRAAAGLGAGRVATLRLVWLPQLMPSLLLGLGLAALLDLASLRGAVPPRTVADAAAVLPNRAATP